MRGALATEDDTAPRFRKIDLQTQTSPGTVDFGDSSDKILVLRLRANNTGVTLSDPRPGQTILFVVQQGVGAPFTWTPAANMKFAGGNKGVTATVAQHRDIYTMIFDGTDWCETGRALDVG